MRILIFLHGTTIQHGGAIGHTRKERVKQVINKDPSVKDYANYVPIGKAANTLRKWKKQGAVIDYLSSHTNKSDVAKDKSVIRKHKFPLGRIYYRKQNETYSQVAERIMPDIIIEDDCESIGGKKEMTYYGIKKRLKKKIKSIVTKEFQGIDHLPDNIKQL